MTDLNQLVITVRASEAIARNLFEIELEIMNITRCSVAIGRDDRVVFN
jgi:hypothetical protein